MKKIILLSTILLALVFAFQACNNEEETPDPVTPDPPVINDFTPKTGGEGTEVTITGSNFTAEAEVTFADNKDATVTFVSATELTATVPADAVTGKIKVSIGSIELETVEDFTVENAPPSAFNLVAVADEATDIDLQPTFEWEAATDPEGGAVTYEIFLDQTEDPTTSIAGDLTGTTYELTERLSLIENYNWKVVATDEQGNETSSDVFSFETRTIRFPEQAVTENAEFGPRFSHTSAVFDDKIWVIGGSGESGAEDKEIWSSTDGINWNLATAEPAFPFRRDPALISYKNKLWMIGGVNGFNRPLPDVWSSTDGVNWTLEKDTVAFPPRAGHTSIVYDDKIWVIGGYASGSSFSDVWYSNDGINWTEATSNANFGNRLVHTSIVYNNKMWLMGGSTSFGSNIQSDVWYSSDGEIWTEATDQAAFGPIRTHTSIVYDNKMWVIGQSPDQESGNIIWYSSDGETWEEAVEDVPFQIRTNHTSVIYENKVWIIGGFYDGPGSTFEELSDVWYFD